MARTAPTKTAAKAPARKAKPAPESVTSVGIPAPETIVVRSKRVACDGVGGALGHPRVWLEMGEANFVECSYCDRRFVLAVGAEGKENELTAPGVYEGSHGH